MPQYDSKARFFLPQRETALCNSESCPELCVKQVCIYRMQRETLEKPPDHPVMTDLLVKQTAFAKIVPFVEFHALV